MKAVNIKQIRVFSEVYKEKSITKAAQHLNMTQPATSLALRELEAYFGTKLFERSGRGIRPTEAAHHFYTNASRLVSLYEEMDDDMKNWNISGRLKIGSSISIGSCVMPKLMKKFRGKYPDLDVYVKIDSSDVIEKNILENHLDFALIEGYVHSDKIKSTVFLDDELLPICSRFNELAGRENVEVSRLKQEQFLMREKNSGTRELAESSLALLGLHIKPVMESTSTAAIINAVATDLGISILPKRMLESQLRMHQVMPFSIKGMDLKRHYHLIYHESKYISPVMQDFFDMLFELE